MKLAQIAAVGAGVLAFAAAVTAQRPGSDEIVVPQSDGQSGLCVPFDCATRIQQVFDSATIPATIRIDALELFNNVKQGAEGFLEPAHYQIFLSRTHASSTTLSTDMDANVGRNARQVADFTIADFNTFFTGAFHIPLAAPFVYNPHAGNLLLEIRKDQTANFGDGPVYVDGTTQGIGIALVTDQLGLQPGVGMSVGLVGQFLGPFSR
jgi:hypothetical protein